MFDEKAFKTRKNRLIRRIQKMEEIVGHFGHSFERLALCPYRALQQYGQYLKFCRTKDRKESESLTQ